MSVEVMSQDAMFEGYFEIVRFFGREPDPWHLDLLQDAFSEDKIVPVWISMFGTSQINWDFGHVDKILDGMFKLYGDTLKPYFEAYSKTPLHGGGTAYGQEYLSQAKRRGKAFCERGLRRLEEAVKHE